MTRLTTHQFHNKRPSMHLKVAGQRAFCYNHATKARFLSAMRALANMSVVVCRRYLFNNVFKVLFRINNKDDVFKIYKIGQLKSSLRAEASLHTFTKSFASLSVA